jgi:hypothetical protein
MAENPSRSDILAGSRRFSAQRIEPTKPASIPLDDQHGVGKGSHRNHVCAELVVVHFLVGTERSFFDPFPDMLVIETFVTHERSMYWFLHLG